MLIGTRESLKMFQHFVCRNVVFLPTSLFVTSSIIMFFKFPVLQYELSSLSLVPDPSDILIQGWSDIMEMNSSLVPLRGIGDSHLHFDDGEAKRVFYVEKFPMELALRDDPVDPEGPPLKKILFWNDFLFRHFLLGYGQEPFLRAGCKVNTCTTTANRTKYPLEDLDAVLVHIRSDDRSIPPTRSPHTRYVYFLRESPSHTQDLRHFDGLFNWTFSYRADSDFPHTYGTIFRRRVAIPKENYTNIMANKTKLCAWFVSNCYATNRRESFVEEMRKTMEVDSYGNCGAMKCPGERSASCYQMLDKDYKFYLSYENSFCQDYISEKLYDVLRLNVVPVVMGFGNYKDIAPPHSYIDVLDFPNATALSEYLLYLDKNDTAYLEYFNWKQYHYLPAMWGWDMRHWCNLCERLHTDNTTKTWDHLHEWWHEGGHCRNSFEDARDYILNEAKML